MSKSKEKEQQDEVLEQVEVPLEETVCEEANQPTEIEKLQQENKELGEKLLRQFAEFDNYKKRTVKERLELSSYTKALCLQGFLSVVDNFERALQFESQDAEFKKGMEMIFTQLGEALKNQGLEEFEALNQPFDPELHNAINQIEDENFGENTVCNVMQKGYKLGDKVVRHAMVVVANP